MHTIERNGERELEQKLLTLASWDNGIKTDVVAVVLLYAARHLIVPPMPSHAFLPYYVAKKCHSGAMGKSSARCNKFVKFL